MPRAKKTKWIKTTLEWPTTSTGSSTRKPGNDGTAVVGVDATKSTESIESIEVFPVEAETSVENNNSKNRTDDKNLGPILAALPHEDRLIYRQVCQEWKETLDPDLTFGLLISDETQKIFNTLETGTLKPVSIKNIAVYDLHGPFKLPTGFRLENDINVYIGMTLKMIHASKFDQETLKAEQNAARLSTKVGNIPESASKENIYEILKSVVNATENLTISLLAPTRYTELGRDFFDDLHFPHLKSLECHIYESDLKAFHYGLFSLTFPNLTRAHFHYYVKPLAASMDDCFQLYAFIVKHKVKLEKLVLNDPPVPHHRRNPQGNHDLPPLNMEEIQLCSFELAISHREQYNHRTFDLKFIRSQQSLKFAKLSGVSLPETYMLLRKNTTTLTEFHIRDYPGHRTLQRSKLFDCGSLETVSNLKICCCHDFRLSNLQKLPSSIEHFTAVNLFDDKAPSLTLPADLKAVETRTAGLAGVTPIQTVVIMPNSTDIVMMQRVNGVRKLYTNRRDKAGDQRAIQIQLPAISTTIKTAYTFITHETFQQELLQIEWSLEQERIRLRNEVSTTSLLDLPSKLQRKIYEKLPIEDRKVCRLVNKKMRDQVEHVMQFGFWLNDSTLDWVQNTKLEIEWMAVSHLMTPLTPAKLSFLANVGDLVIEVHPATFTIGTEADCNDTPDLIYMPNKASSILESNLIKVLKGANKAFSLCLHRWALSCIKNYEKIDKLMADVGLPNLSELTVIVTGNEIKAFCPLLKMFFPKLKEVNFKFFELPKTLTLTQYVDIFKFLINHKTKLRRLQLINPPLQPGDLKNAPVKLNLTTKLVNEIMSLKIQTLTLKLLENLPETKSFSLGETLLENSSALVSLHCEGFPSGSVNKAVTRSAQTLTNLVVYGRNNSGVQMSSIMNLEKCTKLKNLVVKDFNKISYIPNFPKSLVSLDLNCAEGVSSGDMAYISGLPNLEQVIIYNEEFLPRSTYQAFLTNPKLGVLALAKHDKEMFKVLGRRDGIDIMFTDRCPSDLLTRADGEKDTKKHGSQEVNDQGTDELENLVAFHVDHNPEPEQLQLQQNLFGIPLPAQLLTS